MIRRSRCRVAATTAALALAFWLGPARPAHGQRALIEVAIHLKVLAYDRNLVTADRRRIVVGILYLARAQHPGRSHRDVVSAFRSLAGKATVQGIPVSIVVVPVTEASLQRSLAGVRVDVLYVPIALRSHTAAIARMAAVRDLPTLCSSLSQVSQGLAVAVIISGQKPEIVINLRAARNAGMDLSSRLLRMARVL